MLTDQDEHPHQPPAPLPERWQENYFVLGLDEEANAGFTVHLERFPDRGLVETKVNVALDGDIVSLTSSRPLGPNIGGGDTRVEIIEPFHRWHLHHDGEGHGGRGPLGFVGHGNGPAIALGVDVTLDSPLGGIDHSDVLRGLSLPGTERDHYEACGTWQGRLCVGEREIEGRGLFVRDHTWGQRQYAQFSSAWWFPSCFDDGACYVGGGLVHYGERSGGYAIIADADGIDASTDVDVRADGVLEPAGYPSTVVTARFPDRGDVVVTSESRLHLPHYFPGFADRYYCNDALSTVTWGDRRGFGPRELNSYLSESDARILDASTH